MQGSHLQYRPPSIRDYGTLARMTASFHPLLGQVTGQDLSFSDPNVPHHGVSSGGGSGGEGSGGGAGTTGGGSGGGGGGGGAGKGLPFTGLAVGLVAGVGSGLTAAGGALRRAVRERRGR
jgi:hypothetical protein